MFPTCSLTKNNNVKYLALQIHNFITRSDESMLEPRLNNHYLNAARAYFKSLS